jgi:hypothetical protein
MVRWLSKEMEVDEEGDQAHARMCRCGSAISFRQVRVLTAFGQLLTSICCSVYFELMQLLHLGYGIKCILHISTVDILIDFKKG